MPFILSVVPIVLLIFLMIKKNPLASYVALPLTAILILILHLVYFHTDLVASLAAIFSGLGLALTPITIIFGAILFNKVLEETGAMDTIRAWLSSVTTNPVGQLMIIGWAFAFMIEGASGFGTPAAIAAPLLISLGFRALPVAMLALVMNSVPVNFGAVGTPTWFGFGNLGLSEEVLSLIGFKSSIISFFIGFVVVIFALKFVVSFKEIKRNIVFVYSSVLLCTVPLVLIAKVNYEFPSLVAGAIGTVGSIFLAKMGFGLAKDFDPSEIKYREDFVPVVSKDAEEKVKGPSAGEVFKAISPFLILIGLLVITRIKQLGIKSILNNTEALFTAHVGSLFDFSFSKALIFKFTNIFGTSTSFDYKTLYVPALIPFVVAVIISLFIFKTSGSQTKKVFGASFSAIKLTYVALAGALAMVQLMKVKVGVTGFLDSNMIQIIGKQFASSLGDYWVLFAAYLGSIGAFFSGSNTVSNLTFSGIQKEIAEASGYQVSTILALQNVGGAMGNMTCLNNIIAVCSVTGVKNLEGHIIVRTAVPMFTYGILAAIIGYIGIGFFGW